MLDVAVAQTGSDHEDRLVVVQLRSISSSAVSELVAMETQHPRNRPRSRLGCKLSWLIIIAFTRYKVSIYGL
jgi:hypothetical protein